MTQRALALAVSAVIFCSAGIVSSFAQESAIQTNAQGGVFSADRRFWFAVPDGQRLRLLVNGNETYRGIGPASATVSAKPGEDRSYEVTAERRSAPPEDAVLESRTFIVRIDSAQPAPVKIAGSQEAGPSSPWTLTFDAEPGSRVFAAVDADSYVSFHSDVGGPLVFSAKRVEGLAWCVDAAGNASVPAPFSFKPFSLSIANPASGAWANRQLLIVDSEGASEVFWSDDGQDPFGPSGKRYEGPSLIDKTGSVKVLVAAKSPDGRLDRKDVSFTVDMKENRSLDPLKAAEAKPVLSPTALPIPAACRWDIGAEVDSSSGAAFPFAGGRDVVLRPIAGLRRFVPLFVNDGNGLHRFLFVLGSEKNAAELVPANAAPASSDIPSAPTLYSSGRSRLLAWERKQGAVRYRWKDGEEWKDSGRPVSVASEGGVLEWIVDKGTSLDGPFSRSFPALAAEASFPSAAPRSSLPSGTAASSAVELSAPPDFEGVRFSLSSASAGAASQTVELSRNDPLVLDVCDGEQFSWTAAGDGFSVSVRIDRRPPAPPRVDAPEEGAWSRDAPVVSFSVAEGRCEAVARWKDEGGRTGSYALGASSRLRSFKKGLVEYEIEAKTVDEAGNSSPSVFRRFTVDESTVYASFGSGGKTGDGSRASPFASLNEALALARAQGRSRVWISGGVTMKGRAELFDGVSVEGGYGADWKRTNSKSEIVFAQDSSISTKAGTARLSGLSLRESGSRALPPLSVSGSTLELDGVSVIPSVSGRISAPALSARSNAVVTAKDCAFGGGSPAVEAESSRISFIDCMVSAGSSKDNRSVALGAVDSSVRLEASRLEAGKNDSGRKPEISVCADIRGGSLTLIRTVIDAAASDSAGGIAARGAVLDADDSDVSAAGNLYASALSVEGGKADFLRGRLTAAGRDSVALIHNDAQPSRFDGVRFSVEGSGVVRAVQVRGPFPALSGCRFSAKRAAGAEALAGDAPSSGSVRGNLFSGFPYLYGRMFDSDSLAAFNRRFAGKGPANELAETDGM